LTDYERYVSEQNDKNKEAHLKSFLSSVKRHVNQLSEKTYHDIDKLNTPDFVLMFLCIEAAYILAIQKDSNLHSYAWDKKIIIVCPSTLYATLRTINAVWRLELQNQNALEIAKKGGELYDKLVAFVEDLTKVGSQLETVKKTYDLSMNKLRTGTGNLVTRAEGLKKLGIKCNKKLPVELIDQDDDAEEASP
jgi:DNA recombination protein RmuC